MRHLLAYKLRSSEDAQDATQDVFLKLVRHERAGTLRDDAMAYLHTAAHTAAIDAERRRHADVLHRHDDVDECELATPASTHDEIQHWREAVATLVESLRELPDVTQHVFLLYHVDGLSHLEIRTRLGVSLRSVERHMARALTHCRLRLGNYL